MTLYYTPPNEKIFNEMKQLAISIWSTYDDTYGYASKKINIIKDIKNVKDNFMYIFAMFDCHNQSKLRNLASVELKKDLMIRLIENRYNIYE